MLVTLYTPQFLIIRESNNHWVKFIISVVTIFVSRRDVLSPILKVTWSSAYLTVVLWPHLRIGKELNKIEENWEELNGIERNWTELNGIERNRTKLNRSKQILTDFGHKYPTLLWFTFHTQMCWKCSKTCRFL